MIAALLLTFAAVILHIREWLNAGGLWRDEVNSVVLCRNASIRSIWDNLQYDSFPMLWHLSLRAVLNSGVCATDFRIRAVGLLCGLAIVLILWINARLFGRKTPLLELFLLQFTSAVILFGDSIRGHGLGIVLGLCLFGLLFKFAYDGGAFKATLAFIVAILSVHATFYNCITVLACCCGGAAVAFVLDRRQRAAFIGLIGVLAALSMLIYLPAIHRAQRFMMLVQFPWKWNFAGHAVVSALNPVPEGLPYPIPAFIWPTIWVLIVAGVLGATPMLLRRDAISALRFSRRACTWLYSGIVLLVAIPAYLAFLHRMSYVMQPWYFITGFSLVAACCGPISATLLEGRYRFRAIAILLAIAGAYIGPLWSNTGLAKTNIDAIDASLRRLALPGDVIVVEPWNYAVTVSYYAPGPATLMPWPPVSFFQYLKYDQLFPFMTGDRPLAAPKEQLLSALRGKHTLWLIAQTPVETGPSDFDSAPRPGTGWWSGYYEISWARSLNGFLTSSAKEIAVVNLKGDNPNATGTLSYEAPVLLRCSGLSNGRG